MPVASNGGDSWSHTVKAGQNYAGISKEYYGLFNWMDIQRLNPGVNVYNHGKPLPAGTKLRVPGPGTTLGILGFSGPGVPEGKFGGIFQIIGSLLIDSPHSPIYFGMKPGQLRQNRAYHNDQLGYYEWSRSGDGIMKVTNYAGYTKYGGTWRGVYPISTGYFDSQGFRVY
nr:LysM peptidoglycan-binding domain-containing protein [Ancylomarina sp. DW003]